MSIVIDPYGFSPRVDLAEFVVWAPAKGRLIHVHRTCNRGIGSAETYNLAALLAGAASHTCPFTDAEATP